MLHRIEMKKIDRRGCLFNFKDVGNRKNYLINTLSKTKNKKKTTKNLWRSKKGGEREKIWTEGRQNLDETAYSS